MGNNIIYILSISEAIVTVHTDTSAPLKASGRVGHSGLHARLHARVELAQNSESAVLALLVPESPT